MILKPSPDYLSIYMNNKHYCFKGNIHIDFSETFLLGTSSGILIPSRFDFYNKFSVIIDRMLISEYQWFYGTGLL